MDTKEIIEKIKHMDSESEEFKKLRRRAEDAMRKNPYVAFEVISHMITRQMIRYADILEEE